MNIDINDEFIKWLINPNNPKLSLRDLDVESDCNMRIIKEEINSILNNYARRVNEVRSYFYEDL